MPNIMTHALCAHDILQEFPHNYVHQCILKHMRVYSTASSGPDFLFYYKAYPFQDAQAASEVQRVGEKVHRESINAFYLEAIQYIKQTEDGNEREILVSFIIKS